MNDLNSISDYGAVTPVELLEINRKLIRSWPGVTPQGLKYMRSINSDGANIPLFWIFQGQDALSRLASALPAEQPIYGLRSMVFKRSLEELKLNLPFLGDEFQAPICEAYAEEIETITRGGPYLLGGNCGGATIAVNIALRAARKPACLFVMNLLQDASEPYADETELLFGSEERAGFDGYPLGPAAFPNARMTELAGPHGSYFRGPEVRRIVDVISRHSRVLL